MTTYLKKQGKVPTEQRAVFLETSRRSGKTDMLAIITAACLLVIPNLTMLGWSLQNDTSELFAETVAAFIVDMGGGHLMRKSKQKVVVRSEDDPSDIRIIRLHGSKNPNVRKNYIYIIFSLKGGWSPPIGNHLFPFLTLTANRLAAAIDVRHLFFSESKSKKK